MTSYVADTSAWHRSGRERVAERWKTLLLSDRIAICSPVRLELLYSARGRGDYASLSASLASLAELPLGRAASRRAEKVQAALAERSEHRGPTAIDLYIAAITELGGATLLHYDRHFDAISRVTKQPTEWLAPRGSLD